MVVSLALIGAWAFLGVRRTLNRQVDETLQWSSQIATDVLAAHLTLSEHPGSADRRQFVSAAAVSSAVRPGPTPA